MFSDIQPQKMIDFVSMSVDDKEQKQTKNRKKAFQ